MLDTFIIERIRREKERAREGAARPLRIERPPPEEPVTRRRERPDEGEKRGSVVIDFTL